MQVMRWGRQCQDIWAASPTDVFCVSRRAIQDRDFVIKWDGAVWSMLELPTDRVDLLAVWGSDASDVWFVGSKFLRWSGAQLVEVTTGATVEFSDVHGTAADDVWAVGRGGAIMHFDGSVWSAVPSGTTENLHSVWARTRQDAWAIGPTGAIVHWDGSSWSPVTSPVGPAFGGFSAVWAAPPPATDARIANVDGVLHWDGSSWTSMGLPSGSGAEVFWGSSASDVWLAGRTLLRWNGSRWAAVASLPYVDSIWGTSSTDVWFGGRSVVRWDGRRRLASRPGVPLGRDPVDQPAHRR